MMESGLLDGGEDGENNGAGIVEIYEISVMQDGNFNVMMSFYRVYTASYTVSHVCLSVLHTSMKKVLSLEGNYDREAKL